MWPIEWYYCQMSMPLNDIEGHFCCLHKFTNIPRRAVPQRLLRVKKFNSRISARHLGYGTGVQQVIMLLFDRGINICDIKDAA